jgi:penicillin amidase
MLARLGDGSYEVGSRATIIRDRLNGKSRYTARDLLDVQLDAGADFLARWRDLLLQTLEASGYTGRDGSRARLHEIVRDGWTGQASPDSAAYRFTRLFREQVSERVISFLLSECYEADERFRHTTLRRREGPIFRIVSERPLHLLAPEYETWDELLLDAIEAVATAAGGGDLRERVWSEYNVTAYRHPLSSSLPLIGRRLDMPQQPLPGDLFTPRVQWGAIAASERMIVSPGREELGIMHMPTGQSGHPLSPFYANSHPAWVNGDPMPFLPGPPLHTLLLAGRR